MVTATRTRAWDIAAAVVDPEIPVLTIEDLGVLRTVLAPAWTTDWMTDAGKQKLAEFGIAPPNGRAPARGTRVSLSLSVKCPQCGSLDTREVSRYGSTSCKALYECRACLEPFDF